MKGDDKSHYLIYQVLGITNNEKREFDTSYKIAPENGLTLKAFHLTNTNQTLSFQDLSSLLEETGYAVLSC